MTTSGVEPLAQDIAELFAAERRAPRPSALREAGVLARLQPLVGVTAAVATGVGAGMAAASAAGAPPTVAAGSGVVGASVPATGTVAAMKGAAVALPASKALIAGVALAVASAGVGTSAYFALRGDSASSGATRGSIPPAAASAQPGPVIERMEPSEPSPIPAAPPVTAPITVPVAAGPVAPARAVSTRPVAAVASAPGRSVASAAISGTRSSARAGSFVSEPRADMAAESALLEGARRSLDRGAVDSALVDLEKHARTYPAGYLTEEREVLEVRALVLAGRRESAERRAAAFRKVFPRSIQLEALARALDAKP